MQQTRHSTKEVSGSRGNVPCQYFGPLWVTPVIGSFGGQTVFEIMPPEILSLLVVLTLWSRKGDEAPNAPAATTRILTQISVSNEGGASLEIAVP